MGFVLGARAAYAEQRPVSYNRDIRPILAENCFACHGPDASTREADLRLDTAEGATADLGGYAAIVPGDVDASEVIARMTDPAARMPPEESGKELSTEQIELVRRWIAEGAAYEPHWAWIPPRRVEPPPIANDATDDEKTRWSSWPRGEIDRFILAHLQAEGLSPAPEADRVTLIRRLSFDLTGLPPSAEDVARFVGDESPEAYEMLVDRLLASPHYGERMAMHWLDLARYADSVGYHGDQPVSVSPFRDYVIDAFNENLPFDRFTREQLAGDLLPEATREQVVASGYNRLGMMSAEGGAQPKEYLAKYAAERVRAVSGAWLGATMGCAECHDHKFDPFTTKDFYAFQAFFADIQERGLYSGRDFGPDMPVPTPEEEARIAALKGQIADIEAVLDTPTPALAEAQRAWEAEIREKIAAGELADAPWFDGRDIPAGKRSGTFDFVDADAGPVLTSASRKQSGEGIVQHFVLEVEQPITLDEGTTLYAYVWLDPQNPPQAVMLQFHDGTNWDHRAYWGEDRIRFGGIGNDTPGHRPQGPLPTLGEWVRLTVDPQSIGFEPGATIHGMAFTQYNGTAYWDQAGRTKRGANLPDDLLATLEKPEEERTDDESSRLAAHYRTIAPQLAQQREALSRLQKELADIENNLTRTLITVSVEPRPIRLLPRGNWMDESGPLMEPQVPEFLGPLDLDQRGTRLDLADWLVSPDNPLTARVYVNRLWKLFFGRGIVTSLDDFGLQGTLPTHPELLDYLALEFVESGWNVKHVVKAIVMSAAYRQSSLADEAARQQDPYNMHFARQGRFRLDAEMVRDNALAVSGLLVRKVGGVSVRPYQPPGYWAHLNFPRREYEPSTGDDLWRRSVYTHWQRQYLHPSLLMFDAPSREECTMNRPRSNTPLAALVLLNDPIFVEAARALGERMLLEGGDSLAERIDFAVRQTLSRQPTSEESEVLAGIYARYRATFDETPTEAEAFLSIGARPLPSGVDRVELAALAGVARVILNLHETITRR